MDSQEQKYLLKNHAIMKQTIINNITDIESIKIIKSSVDEKIIMMFFSNGKIMISFELTENEFIILQDAIKTIDL